MGQRTVIEPKVLTLRRQDAAFAQMVAAGKITAAAMRRASALARARTRDANVAISGKSGSPDQMLPPPGGWDRAGFTRWWATLEREGLLDGVTGGDALGVFRDRVWRFAPISGGHLV